MEWISGSIFIRPMGPFEPGQQVDGHAHRFDHTTIFFNGRWLARRARPAVGPGGENIWVEDARVEREGPFHLLIEAGCQHSFTFIGAADGAPGEAWCVYSHRNPQGEVSEAYTGWDKAYQ